MQQDLLANYLASKQVVSGRPLTAAEKLVVKTWPVFVSRSQVLSPEYADFIGVIAGTPGSESVNMHGGINTALSIAKLAEIYAIGGRPHFRQPKDTVEIYRDLTGYLFEFRKAYNSNHFTMNVSDKLAENILKLENFAEWVSGIAAQYTTKEDLLPANTLAGRIGRGRFTRELFNKKPPKDPYAHVNATNTVLPPGETTHVRITDSVMEQHFEQKVINRTKAKASKSTGWS